MICRSDEMAKPRCFPHSAFRMGISQACKVFSFPCWSFSAFKAHLSRFRACLSGFKYTWTTALIVRYPLFFGLQVHTAFCTEKYFVNPRTLTQGGPEHTGDGCPDATSAPRDERPGNEVKKNYITFMENPLQGGISYLSKMTVRGTMVRSEVCNSWCFCLES